MGVNELELQLEIDPDDLEDLGDIGADFVMICCSTIDRGIRLDVG